MNANELRAKQTALMTEITVLQNSATPDNSRISALLDELEALGPQLTNAERIETLERPIRKTAPARAEGARASPREGLTALADFARGLTNTVQLGVAGDGGNVVGPEWDRQINSVAFAYSPMRQIARVVRAASGQWQTVIASTGVSAQIIATDVTTRTDSTTPAFQKVAPPGCGLSACAPLTSWILDDAVGTSGYDLERFIFESIGQQFAVAEGALFINGTGTSQPRGLLAGTAPTEEADSARAFGTLQFTKSGVAATLGTNLDPVISALYSLKPAYRAKASFLMAPGTLQVLRQMKDGQNRYLWEPAPKAGEPSTLLGVPVFEDPNMDAIGANKFPIAVGDFTTGYCIVDAGTPRFVRDDVSSKGLVKIYMERRVHGSVCDSNAIRLVKCAA